MGKVVAAGIVLVSVVVAARQQPSPKPPPVATGLIVGRVIDGVTNQPVAEATVMTAGSTFLTAADGRFVMRGVKPGPVGFRVLKSGYSGGQFGQTRPGGPARTFVLREGEKTADVSIRIWRTSSITGRVTDEAGEPLIGVEVRALRRVVRAGEWRWGGTTSTAADATAQTDDRGIYRMDGIMPGAWIVGVLQTTATVPTSVAEAFGRLTGDASQRAAYQSLSDALFAARAPRVLPGDPAAAALADSVRALGGASPASSAATASFVYPSEYFAGASAPGRATVVAIEPGQERAGIDISLRPVRSVRVSGTLAGPDGPGAHVPLQLLSPESADIDGDTPVATTVSDATGRFVFHGVPPGPYTLRAFKAPSQTQSVTQVGAAMSIKAVPPPPDAPSFWARETLVVGQSDVAGLVVSLKRGVRVSGTVVFEGEPADAAPADFRSTQLLFDPADGRAQSFLSFAAERLPMTAPRFHTIEMPPGRYFLRTTPGPWTLVSMTSGGRDVSEVALVLEDRPVTDLVATFTKQRRLVSGSVRGPRNETVTDAFAVAFPANRQGWVGTGAQSRRFQLVRTSPAGAYEFRDLPAGDYLLIALLNDPGDDWRDPALLAQWSGEAVRVAVTGSTAAGPELRAQDRRGPSWPAPEDSRPPAPMAADVPAGGPFAHDEVAPEVFGPQAGATAGAAPKGPGQISGLVETPDGPVATPVRRAIVTVSCAAARIGQTFVTDETGRFLFEDLPACRYLLTAQKPGFLAARYGATGVDRPGTPITLAEGGRVDVRLAMQRGAVVSGTVRNTRGDPLPNALVQVMRYRNVGDEQRLEWVMTAGRQVSRTDGRGEYRVYGLPPGEFVVGATLGFDIPDGHVVSTAADVQQALEEVRGGAAPAAPQPASARTLAGFAATFHPRATDPVQAAIVKLEAGEERGGIDISTEVVRLARIRLVVTGPDGRTPAVVQARFTTPVAVGGFIGTLPLFPATAKGGEVTLPLIGPGNYTIAVSGSMQPLAPNADARGNAASANVMIGFPLWAIVPVTVTGQDVDLPVQLEHGRTVSGRVAFEGSGPAPAVGGTMVGLVGPRRSGVPLSTPEKPVSAAGTFEFDSVVPAAYRVAAVPPKGWTLQSAIVNGRDASDRPVEITGDVSDAVVTFTNRTTELSGMLQTPEGRPAPDYHVIVFPRDQAYWIHGTRRIVSLRPGTDGRFVASSLPPGEYWIGAMTDVVNDEWFNPSVLEALVPGAVKVTLRYDEKTVQDLRIR